MRRCSTSKAKKLSYDLKTKQKQKSKKSTAGRLPFDLYHIMFDFTLNKHKNNKSK
jgi:hypothetical protein